jgi:hypothetical protein
VAQLTKKKINIFFQKKTLAARKSPLNRFLLEFAKTYFYQSGDRELQRQRCKNLHYERSSLVRFEIKNFLFILKKNIYIAFNNAGVVVLVVNSRLCKTFHDEH